MSYREAVIAVKKNSDSRVHNPIQQQRYSGPAQITKCDAETQTSQVTIPDTDLTSHMLKSIVEIIHKVVNSKTKDIQKIYKITNEVVNSNKEKDNSHRKLKNIVTEASSDESLDSSYSGSNKRRKKPPGSSHSKSEDKRRRSSSRDRMKPPGENKNVMKSTDKNV